MTPDNSSAAKRAAQERIIEARHRKELAAKEAEAEKEQRNADAYEKKDASLWNMI